jgi:GNAT superfamily N-acetyltransferase
VDPTFRRAQRSDVRAIVELLADDDLGGSREQAGPGPLPASYAAAFDAIDADERELLVVADLDGEVVGTLQLSFLPSLTYGGAERAQVEAVRVAARVRGHGVGRRMLEWAVDLARDRGCRIVQLTTDKRREDAARFYESIGFVASHEGMKLHL